MGDTEEISDDSSTEAELRLVREKLQAVPDPTGQHGVQNKDVSTLPILPSLSLSSHSSGDHEDIAKTLDDTVVVEWKAENDMAHPLTKKVTSDSKYSPSPVSLPSSPNRVSEGASARRDGRSLKDQPPSAIPTCGDEENCVSPVVDGDASRLEDTSVDEDAQPSNNDGGDASSPSSSGSTSLPNRKEWTASPSRDSSSLLSLSDGQSTPEARPTQDILTFPTRSRFSPVEHTSEQQRQEESKGTEPLPKQSAPVDGGIESDTTSSVVCPERSCHYFKAQEDHVTSVATSVSQKSWPQDNRKSNGKLKQPPEYSNRNAVTGNPPQRTNTSAVVGSTSRGEKVAQIQDVGQVSEPEPDIHFSLYSPPAYRARTAPVVHKYTAQTHPLQSRLQLKVEHIFTKTTRLLWQSKCDSFNALQSEVSSVLCHSDDHVVVSAPTGAGKTMIFEMAIAKFIQADLRSMVNSGIVRLSNHRKMVYIAPSKALCEERYDDWKKRLSKLQLGLEVSMVTGDVDPGSCYHDLTASHVILTTPEKWDSLSRKWSERFFLLASVKLFMIDEAHLLGDESRGACLESIVLRMKTIQRAAQNLDVNTQDMHSCSYVGTTPEALSSIMRIVAVSATLPNIADVAEFVGATECYVFDESYRPVPLTKHVAALGFVGNNEFRFWSSLDRHVPEFIARFANEKQTLIFCHTKKETQQLAGLLISKRFGGKNAQSSSAPGTLQHCLDNGVGFHHAGMEPTDRHRVELAFASGSLRCLCATSTLAVGVNLPAHLVIVKGTKTWRGGGQGYQEIDKCSLLQMMGRAGRPGLDTHGIAVIMTDNNSKASVESLIQGLGPAESQLMPKLNDILNHEISQRVVTDRDGACRWLKNTFLFTRLRRNHSENGQTGDAYLSHLANEAVQNLVDAGLAAVTSRGQINPLPAGHIMNQSMVPFEAMKSITALSFDATLCQVLKTLSKMSTFHYPVRRHEKKPLNEMHKTESIRFKLEGPPSKVRVKESWEKAFVLLQAYIGQCSFQNYTLSQEMTSIADSAQRVLLAAQEFSVQGSGNGHVALQCLRLRRSLHFCLWGESGGVLNQIEGVGQQCTNSLKFNGIVSFQQAFQASEEKLESAAGKPPPFGKKLKSLIRDLLSRKLKVTAEVEYTRGSNIASSIICHIERDNIVSTETVEKGRGNVTYTAVAFTDRPGSCLVFKEGITDPVSYRFACPPKYGKLFIHLVASVVGMDDAFVLEGISQHVASSFMKSSKKCSSAKDRASQWRPVQQTRAGDSPRRKTCSKPLSTKHPKCVHRVNSGGKPPRTKTQLTIQGPERTREGVATITPQGRQAKRVEAPPPCQHNPNTSAWTQRCSSFGQANGKGNCSSQSTLVSAHAKVPYVGVVTQPFQNDSSTSGAILRGTNADTPTKRPVTSSSWNQTRRKQHRLQQRAFATTKDNPFALFQHDPNDAESFLEGLSGEQSGLIPAQELQVLSRRTRPIRSHGALTQATHKRKRRQFGSQPSISSQELLRIKAAEAGVYAISPQQPCAHNSAPFRNPQGYIESGSVVRPAILQCQNVSPQGEGPFHQNMVLEHQHPAMWSPVEIDPYSQSLSTWSYSQSPSTHHRQGDFHPEFALGSASTHGSIEGVDGRAGVLEVWNSQCSNGFHADLPGPQYQPEATGESSWDETSQWERIRAHGSPGDVFPDSEEGHQFEDVF